MDDFSKKKIKLDDRKLFEQFTNGVGGAFQAYKKNSSIQRTLLKCKFKEKELTDKDLEILKAVELAIFENSNKKRKSKL